MKFSLMQLRPYWSGTSETTQEPARAATRADTAAEILGLGRSRRHPTVTSLEREVAAYLDDFVEDGLDMLGYWQV